jgi:hypothetical protein
MISVLLAYALAVAAILAMGVALVQALRLGRSIVGGEVGDKWKLLTLLIGFFFVGYLVSPLALFFELPAQYLNLLVFGVFLGGAAFVLVVIGIIRDVLRFLKLLR